MAKKKDRSFEIVQKDVDEQNISNENHMQMFDRLVAAGIRGMHNPPSPRQKKG